MGSKFLQILYTIGPEAFHDNYHVEVVRSPLTRNLAARFPDVQDEIRSAFEEFIPQTQGQKSYLSLVRGLIFLYQNGVQSARFLQSGR